MTNVGLLVFKVGIIQLIFQTDSILTSLTDILKIIQRSERKESRHLKSREVSAMSLK